MANGFANEGFELSTGTESSSSSVVISQSLVVGLSHPIKTSQDGKNIDEEKAKQIQGNDHDDVEVESRQADDAESKLIEEDEFPENSVRAWLVLLGATCNCFATVGYVSTWGIFQAYYEETLLKDLSPSTIAWIGSLQYSLVFLPALVVGRLFDIGYYHSVFFPSSVLLVLATFLTGECTQFWQFFLCQGVAIGLGAGGMFGSRPAVLAHWFKKKRGRALGFSAMGASVSSTLLPVAARNLIPRVGFPWTMRIFGFIMFIILGICNLTLKRRLPPQKVKGGLLHLAAFKEISYTVYCISAFFNFLGLYTLLTYVDVSATNLGSTRDIALYFVAFANAGSFFGRYSSGILADILGSLNITAPITLCAGILTYAWPLAHSTGSLVVVTVLYGFCSGAYVALFTAPVMNLGKEGDVGRRVGMCMTFVALGSVVGPPISGAIYKQTRGFEVVGLYAGSVIAIGVGCMILARYLALGKWAGKV